MFRPLSTAFLSIVQTVLVLIVFASGSMAAESRRQLGWHSLGRWAQPQGLPQNTVFTLLQSTEGYLWIGTRSGVARFDGATFATYDNRDPLQLRDNEVWALAEGDDGSVWIGTYGGGVSRLRDGKFTVYSTRDGLIDDFVSAICKDRSGDIWMATDSGASCFKDGRFINYTTKDGLGSKTVWSVCSAIDGGIWVGAKNGVVNRIKDGKVSVCSLGDNPPASEIRAIYQDETGTLWIGTTMQGLFRLQNGVVTRFADKTSLPSSRVTALHEDAEHNLWIGTTEGLVRYKDGQFSLHRLNENSTRNDSITALTSDREGSLWVGTADEGMVCFRRNLFDGYARADGLPDEFISGIVEDENHDILIATRKGVSRLRDGRLVTYGASNGLPDLSSWGITRDHDDTLWLATEHGVYRCDRGQRNAAGEHLFHHFGADNEALRGISARVITKDRSGVVWIGTTMEGLLRCEGTRVTIFTTKDGLGNNAVRGLCEDAGGALWIGTRGGGLTRLKDGTFTRYTEKEGLVSDLVQTMFMDADDVLWIGTRKGLGRLHQGRFTRYTVSHGLFTNYLSGIGEDHAGNLWMSSAKGVFRVSKAQLNAFAEGKVDAITCIAYGAEHGLNSTVGSVGVHPSVYTSEEGRVWFGTFKGVNAVDPAALGSNGLAPPLHITSVTIDQHRFDDLAAVHAPPGRGDLSFRYSGISFLAPEKMRFKYRLEGYDLDWVDAGNRREAFYSNIPPGPYRFHVIAANSDGVWNETGATIALQLQPHLYQTKWFQFALALLVLGAAIGGIRLRVRRLRRRAEELRRQNVELERRIAERTAELSKSYEDLRASEYFYQSLVESLPQVILRKDAEGRITYANAAFGEMIGRPVDEIVGRPEAEFYPPEAAAKFSHDDLRIMATRQPMEMQSVIERDGGSKRYLQVKKVPLYGTRNEPIGVQVLFWDMTVFRETEEKLKEAQRELIEISRLAGIAEVATGVLHNLGNALNSVNTAAAIANTEVRKLKIENLRKLSQLVAEQGEHAAEFLATDPRGRRIPEYLALLADDLQSGQKAALHELGVLRASIDHIKEIIAAQQSSAKATGVVEVVPATELIEYALRINEASLTRHGVTITHEFTATGSVKVQRNKALQILGNLIRNADDSLMESGRPDRRLTLGLRLAPGGPMQFCVTDNGVGIAPENLTRIFGFGFTTKKNGHGFGLHSSALAAKELGGSLSATSDGPGKGATFVLELPVATGAEVGTGSMPATAISR